TEPSGGSDPANAIRSRGVKQGDHWVLNGTKTFISHAHEAEWGVVFVRTDQSKGRAGISCFIIDKGTPGFTARPIRTIRT
ncbi:acyl-CoA dehydrogenase family protein, partial [Salmonella sp. SAL4355]|uniref:acyl-CoA dehydrogenase family protein n=1 Tax=Salmonella sp. SAL4355 TaxID=3159876 RepID=UPI00397B509A